MSFWLKFPTIRFTRGREVNPNAAMSEHISQFDRVVV